MRCRKITDWTGALTVPDGLHRPSDSKSALQQDQKRSHYWLLVYSWFHFFDKPAMSEDRDNADTTTPQSKAAKWTEGVIENGVLIGRQSHLFLVGGTRAILDYSSGERRVHNHSYLNFNSNLGMRAHCSTARGARYLHVIFPDKQSVLTNEYPLPSPVCLGDEYLANAGEAAADVLYLKEALKRQPQGCFLRTDTHLADKGLILAGMSIASRFSDALAAALAENIRLSSTEIRTNCGDLGSKLQPQISMPEEYLVPSWPVRVYTNKLARNNGLVDIWFSPASESPSRLLIFGDSFGRGLARILTCVFSEVIFLRTQFFHIDIVDQVRPTHVITQNVERYLTFVEPDRNRPSFHMYPFLGASDTVTLSKDFVEAFSAMLSYPRPPYQKYIAQMQADLKRSQR